MFIKLSHIMEDDYIYCMNHQIGKFKILPKLSIKDIQKYEEPYKMCFYFCYGYSSIYKKYNLESLNRCINKDVNSNLFLLMSKIGNIKVIKYLVFKGVDIHKCNKNLWTAYLIAAFYDNIKLMKYLESLGTNIHKKSLVGNNAYLITAVQHRIKSMKHLEKKGVNIYIKPTIENNFLNKSLGGYYLIASYVFKNKNYKLNRYKMCFI